MIGTAKGLVMAWRIGGAFLLLMLAALPASADNWAITNAPVTIGGETVPAGMYVPVVYDGGDFWYASAYKDADHIPKSSVQLLQKIVPNGPSPIGFKGDRKLYYPGPKVVRPMHALMSDELEAWAPHAMNGFRVLYKEGGAYVVQYGGPENNEQDYREHTRRIAANCVTLANGKAFTGHAINPPFIMESSLIDKPVSLWSMSDWLGQFMTIGIAARNRNVADAQSTVISDAH